jgi:hypothetical protein
MRHAKTIGRNSSFVQQTCLPNCSNNIHKNKVKEKHLNFKGEGLKRRKMEKYVELLAE